VASPRASASVITVGGLPGTGTTTLCRILADRTGLPYTYAGQIFRDEAARRGLDLAAFGALCEQDPAVDRTLDQEQVRLLHAASVSGAPGLILEGRLSGRLARQAQVPALTVWVTCAEPERIRRIVERDGGAPDSQAAKTRTREASEAARYRQYYGFDLEDLSAYDLVLDSTTTLPGALADQVLAALHDRGA
jgi:CMP/dCMP kinase